MRIPACKDLSDSGARTKYFAQFISLKINGKH
jgi:hypothetical protein